MYLEAIKTFISGKSFNSSNNYNYYFLPDRKTVQINDSTMPYTYSIKGVGGMCVFTINAQNCGFTGEYLIEIDTISRVKITSCINSNEIIYLITTKLI